MLFFLTQLDNDSSDDCADTDEKDSVQAKKRSGS